MEFEINHPNTSETFHLKVNVYENNDETIYKVSFTDKRLTVKYGIVELKRKPNNSWVFPENADNLLKSLISEIIFQIMNNEV